MKNTQLLDCTLRDGAYLLDKQFGNNTIKGIIEGLINARTDWIEIGFLQDEGFGEGKTVFLNSKEAERCIPDKHGNSKFTVFADYSRYTIENLDEYTGKSFHGVRACFFREERNDVISFCQTIKQKGYQLFVQPVDTLGYSEDELIELINDINSAAPDCFSVVDTFGSMYEDDLYAIFNLIDEHLNYDCKIGFHSHNNLQMSSSLSQAFLRFAQGRREVIIDSTIAGMGRGAGNTPTELIMQYMISKQDCNYDLDVILDIIDTYIDNFRTRCKWGYSTPFFVAGAYSAHVNNVSYLLEKNSIRSKDLRHILNQVGELPRKRYDYELLENTYLQYVGVEIDDSDSFKLLHGELRSRNVVVMAPGKSVKTQLEEIRLYIDKHNAIVISINFIPEQIEPDYVYMNNAKRYNREKELINNKSIKKIITTNILQENTGKTHIISLKRLLKSGWEHIDNSTILLMRLLDQMEVNSIAIAGFDGYDFFIGYSDNYATPDMELASIKEKAPTINEEIYKMFLDFIKTRRNIIPIEFITSSKFEKALLQKED